MKKLIKYRLLFREGQTYDEAIVQAVAETLTRDFIKRLCRRVGISGAASFPNIRYSPMSAGLPRSPCLRPP